MGGRAHVSIMSSLVRATRSRLQTVAVSRQRSFATAVATQKVTSKDAQPMTETFPQKAYRWLDCFGWFTRWHCRKAWMLDLEPTDRVNGHFVTEYERYLIYWVTGMGTLFMPFCIWHFWGQYSHIHHKPPNPLMLQLSYLNNRKTDFHWHGGMYQLCRDCRPLEFECKKECYDILRSKGFSHKRSEQLRFPMTQAFGPA